MAGDDDIGPLPDFLRRLPGEAPKRRTFSEEVEARRRTRKIARECQRLLEKDRKRKARDRRRLKTK